MNTGVAFLGTCTVYGVQGAGFGDLGLGVACKISLPRLYQTMNWIPMFGRSSDCDDGKKFKTRSYRSEETIRVIVITRKANERCQSTTTSYILRSNFDSYGERLASTVM